MDFIDHITACNGYDITAFSPLFIADETVGWVKHDLAEHLVRTETCFDRCKSGISFDAGSPEPDQRSLEMAKIVKRLADQKLVPPLRQENFPVLSEFRSITLMHMDRAAVPAFGVAAFGCHVNGYVRRDDGGLDLWIGRRSRDRSLYPGMLDNMVAGGLPIDLNPIENVIKEAEEEAGIPAALAGKAQPVSEISYVLQAPDGLKPDTMFCFDLELPSDFVPRNCDGEVEQFYRWPIEKVMEIVRSSFDFKFNCNLVIIDFLIRHGLITENHPDFQPLAKGLRNRLNSGKTGSTNSNFDQET